MTDFTTYPETTSILAFLLVFAPALLICHKLLLPRLGHNEIAWQRIDYVWIGLAIFGLIGTVQNNRSEMASNFVSVWNERATNSLLHAHSIAESYSKPDSHLCTKGERSKSSPPPDIFDAIERDYANACDWFRSLRSILPTSLNDIPSDFAFSSLPTPPQLYSPAASAPAEAINDLRNTISQLLEAETQIKAHQGEIAHPDLFRAAHFFGPFVLAIALAIRLTKVTAEIRIKRRKIAQEG